MKFSKKETLILNRLQTDIPMIERPFEAVASELDCSEDELIKSISGLKSAGIIRDISGIFNIVRLGYQVALIAFVVPDVKIDEAVMVINSHPGVSHNYLRDNRYNIWFTFAIEKDRDYDEAVMLLAEKVGALDVLILKNKKRLKIGLMLDVSSGQSRKKNNFNYNAGIKKSDAREITPDEKKAVRLLQYDIPLVNRPFQSILKNAKASFTEEEFLKIAESFKERGIMRRYAAVLGHQQAGFSANAMTVWKFDDSGSLDMLKEVFVKEQAISHLYLRTASRGKWDYPLFAMIHAKSESDLSEIIEGLSRESGIKDYNVLTTLREFKKQRVRYYSEEFLNWEKENND